MFISTEFYFLGLLENNAVFLLAIVLITLLCATFTMS